MGDKMFLSIDIHLKILLWRSLLIGLLLFVLASEALEVSDQHSEIHSLNKDLKFENVVEFAFKDLTLIESQGLVTVPVIRSGGQFNFSVFVACSTGTGTASADDDFQSRAKSSETSIVTFSPGQQRAFCGLQLYDDDVFEQDEIVELHLSNVTCDSCGANQRAVIGANRVILITIKDYYLSFNNSQTTIQLEKDSYTVREPNSSHHTATVSVRIIRSGNTKRDSTVRVKTSDELGIAGESYHAKTAVIRFEKGQTVKSFDVEILYNFGRRDAGKTFTVQLVTEELKNAVLGAVKVSLVTILSTTPNVVFPAPPVVISPPFYNVDREMLKNLRPPSQPLSCLTSCTSQHPDYLKLKTLCESNGVNTSLVNYSWEVKLPGASSDQFLLLTQNTLFADVNSMVLDPIFFRPGYLVRCVVRPAVGHVQWGPATKSQPVQISNDAVCGEAFKLTALSSFIATLSYVDGDDAIHPNRLLVQVDIPHQDGMLPVISTAPLHNMQLLIGSEFSPRKQHVCSNLIKPGELKTDHPESLFLNPQNAFQRQFDNDRQFNVRGVNASLLYRHLDLERCVWRFRAYFSMGELADNCGGIVSNSVKNEVGGKGFTTIRVPLYVANVFAAANLWTSFEHHTEMEITFNYDSVLMPTELAFDNDVDAYVHIHRIYVEDRGNLVIIFQTKPKFNGLFVMQHQSNPNNRSHLVFPKYTDIHFKLKLVWTASSGDRPIQSWRAVSSYSLKDYTGVYILELIPCVYISSKRISTNNSSSMCVNRKPKRFEIPVVYQQASRPTPVIFSLKTYFQLTNSEARFTTVSDDKDISIQDLDYGVTGPFVKGDNVYGRVLWNPGQDLGSAYRLQIEKVYLCAEAIEIGSVDENDIKTNGCFSANVEHRLLLLDRNFIHDDYNDGDIYNAVRAEAKFIEEDETYAILQKASGVDGFMFKVDGLYKIGSSYKWFAQVIYTIGSASHLRKRRSINESDKHALHLLHNGTVMRHLVLFEQHNSPYSLTLIISNIIMILVIILFLFAFAIKHGFCSDWFSKLSFKILKNRRNNERRDLTNTCNIFSQNSIACYSSSTCETIKNQKLALTGDATEV